MTYNISNKVVLWKQSLKADDIENQSDNFISKWKYSNVPFKKSKNVILVSFEMTMLAHSMSCCPG